MLGEASRISAEAIATGKKDNKAKADAKLKGLFDLWPFLHFKMTKLVFIWFL